MMTEPNIIPVGQEPSPMRTAADQERRAERAASSPKPGNPKGKAQRRHVGDRFRVLNTFIDGTMQTLRMNERAVWLILYRDTKPDGVANTSQASIAERAGISDRTVRRVLQRLATRGLLTVIRRGSLRRGPSVYQVRAVPKGDAA